ncbi:hypothetical protein M758_1G048100 [Ceratodon purpureus]|nr:hypothetical protein M758_1G048100 [Ceratodon purpureus]
MCRVWWSRMGTVRCQGRSASCRSKVLGYCIVAGSVFLKVPQIYVIIKNKSIQGLSVASFELEAAGFTIALAYCLFKQLPFSAYEELVFILT